MKQTTTKSSKAPDRSSGARGAANSGTKKASNAHAARRQGEKAAANKASNERTGARRKDSHG